MKRWTCVKSPKNLKLLSHAQTELDGNCTKKLINSDDSVAAALSFSDCGGESRSWVIDAAHRRLATARVRPGLWRVAGARGEKRLICCLQFCFKPATTQPLLRWRRWDIESDVFMLDNKMHNRGCLWFVCRKELRKHSVKKLFGLRKTEFEFKRKFKKYVNFRFTVWKLAVELRSTCYAEFWRLGRHFMKAFFSVTKTLVSSLIHFDLCEWRHDSLSCRQTVSWWSLETEGHH